MALPGCMLQLGIARREGWRDQRRPQRRYLSGSPKRGGLTGTRENSSWMKGWRSGRRLVHVRYPELRLQNERHQGPMNRTSKGSLSKFCCLSKYLSIYPMPISVKKPAIPCLASQAVTVLDASTTELEFEAPSPNLSHGKNSLLRGSHGDCIGSSSKGCWAVCTEF